MVVESATLEKVRARAGDANMPSLTVDNPALEAQLDAVVAANVGISMLLVSTGDGRAIAYRAQNALDPRRLSAMSNSFLTLGETLSRELGLSTADYVTMSTSQGCMVLVRVAADRPYTLAALGYSDTSLAIVLYAARDAAARIKPLL